MSGDGIADFLEYEDWLKIVPSVHGRAPFAAAVRRAFQATRPDRIAVELPPALGDLVLAGVARLPSLSVISYESPLFTEDDEDHDGPRIHVPIDPADSIVEALRLAAEHDTPVEFVDLLASDYEPPNLAIPDPELAARVGIVGYYDAVSRMRSSYRDPRHAETDRRRDLLIGWRVGALREFGTVLLVCGIAHWPGIERALNAPRTPPDDDETPIALALSHLHEDSAYGLLGEMPFVAHQYERWRSRRRAPRSGGEPAAARWDPELVLELLLERAERSYCNHWGEEVSRPNRRALRRYSAKLAVDSGASIPSLYDLVVAAKGCQDDDLAGEVYDLATRWPHQENPDDLPVVRLDPEQLRRRFRQVRMLRRDPSVFGRGQDPTSVFRRRPREEEGENWKRDWGEESRHGCSYVPEDLRQLEWISFVRHEAPDYLNAQRLVLREFTGNLLDGIDIRETMRNWWRDQIIVREEMRLRGAVGPVVVIYEDEPLVPGRYPNCIVWPGESHDEGDLVLYSTLPGERLVGPGVSRCEYGGFLTLPGIHLGWWQDPWSVLPGSGWVETKGELLLATAALCATEKFVACISPNPPSRGIVARCERLDHPVIHIPSASFTPATLKKLRAFHVLSETGVRSYARDYIEPRPRGFRA